MSKFGAFTSPTKLVAVTIPDANICPPSELIPTPVPKLVGSPPTWKLFRGSLVDTPTFPPVL